MDMSLIYHTGQSLRLSLLYNTGQSLRLSLLYNTGQSLSRVLSFMVLVANPQNQYSLD